MYKRQAEGRISPFSQLLGVFHHGLLIGHEDVAEYGDGQIGSFRTVLGAPDYLTVPDTGERSAADGRNFQIHTIASFLINNG